MKNSLPYIVTSYDICDEPTSSCSFRTEREARKRYLQRVTSAECSNVGRIKMFRAEMSSGRFSSKAFVWEVLDEWVRPVEEVEEPEQEATYIVHSVNTIGNNKMSTFNNQYRSEKAAVKAAKSIVDQWSSSHPGALVFKAVKHVQKVPTQRTRIVVNDIS